MIYWDIRCADCSPPLPSPPWPRLHQLRPLTQLCAVMALWPRSSMFVRPDLAAACSHDHPSRFHPDGDGLAAGVPLLCPSTGSCTGPSPRVKPARPHFERPATTRGLRQRTAAATKGTAREI